MNNIDNPRIGEQVLFDSKGSTYAGKIAWCDDDGGLRIQPDVPINGPVVMENIRRPVTKERDLSEIEKVAFRLKTDGPFAIELAKRDRPKYEAAMDLIRSGSLKR